MEIIKVGITVENNVEIPKYMTEGAAGIDVSANIEKEIELKNFSNIFITMKQPCQYTFDTQRSDCMACSI